MGLTYGHLAAAPLRPADRATRRWRGRRWRGDDGHPDAGGGTAARADRDRYRTRRALCAAVNVLVLLGGAGFVTSWHWATARYSFAPGQGPPSGYARRVGAAGAAPTEDPLPARYRRRLPSFPPRPVAERVDLPGDGAVLDRVPTTQPVAFVTVEAGPVRAPGAVALLRAARVPVTLFLSSQEARADPGYFGRLRAAGAVVEAHGVDQRSLAGRPYPEQQRTVCAAADELTRVYGVRPALFRPPYGTWDGNTLRAVRACGMRPVLVWRQSVQRGVVRYPSARTRVRPGDIIRLRLSGSFADDLVAALQAVHASGLVPAALEEYLL